MLFYHSFPLLLKEKLKVFGDPTWNPTTGKFGLRNFIISTFYVTFLSLFFAVPISILSAILISEYMPSKIGYKLKIIFDVLSGISPVVYGLSGILIIVPIVRDYIQPFIEKSIKLSIFISENKSGYSTLSAALILGIMVSPLMVSITEEVLRAIPFEIRQVTMSLGATKYEMVTKVLLKKARAGIFAGIILSFSRSIGETIAVLMVAGCAIGKSPFSIFDPSYPLPALIANTFGETMSIPLYKSAIFLVALILLFLTVIANVIGWYILMKIEEEGL